MKQVCLAIGGSDSCSGAGIQADLRTMQSIGVHACSAITALTAQNPDQITRIEAVSCEQLAAEMQTIFSYYDVAAVKTGMLLDAVHIRTVASCLATPDQQPKLIIDPVMVSSSGKSLLDLEAIAVLLDVLLPHAHLITPNLDEAAILLGESVGDDLYAAAKALQARLGCAVLLKGGHQNQEQLLDVYCDSTGHTHAYTHPRQPVSSERLHGTGCRLASAIAANLALGHTNEAAIAASIDWLQTQL